MSKPTQAKMIEEMNAKITDLEARLEKLEAVSEEKPKKKPAAKPKASKKEVKVTAGAGAPPDEEESDELKEIKKKIVNSEKYIANEKGKYADDKIELRKKQLVKEQAQLRKLMGDAPDDKKKEETAPVQLSIEELQELDLDVGDKAGKFWDSKNGRFVTGPDEDPDEALTDQKFEGKLYSVGAKTYRVYYGASKDSSFKGYAGVANFKDMVSESDADE
jgi:hypothetical protein